MVDPTDVSDEYKRTRDVDSLGTLVGADRARNLLRVSINDQDQTVTTEVAGALDDQDRIEVVQGEAEQFGVTVDGLGDLATEASLTAEQPREISSVSADPLDVSGATVPVTSDGALDVSAAPVAVDSNTPLDVSGATVPVTGDGPLDVSAATVPVTGDGPLDVSASPVAVDSNSPLDVSGATVGVSSDSPLDVAEPVVTRDGVVQRTFDGEVRLGSTGQITVNDSFNALLRVPENATVGAFVFVVSPFLTGDTATFSTIHVNPTTDLPTTARTAFDTNLSTGNAPVVEVLADDQTTEMSGASETVAIGTEGGRSRLAVNFFLAPGDSLGLSNNLGDLATADVEMTAWFSEVPL